MKPNYEAALSMYSQEHDRWNQWALFFFGAIGAIFYVAGQLSVQAVAPCALATVVSLMWVGVASNIRATTDSWRATLLEFEEKPESTEGAFQVFTRELHSYDYIADLSKTLHVWRRQTYTSVTRLLVLAGLLASVVFLTLTILAVGGSVAVVRPPS